MSSRLLPGTPVTPHAEIRFTRAVVGAGLLIASVAVAIVLGRSGRSLVQPGLILAVVLAISGLMIWLWLRNLEYGIVAMLVAAGSLNFLTLPTGTQSRIVISLVIGAGCVGAWILKLVTAARRPRLKPSHINRPLLAFIAIGFVSYGWSNLMRDPVVYVWGSFPFVQLAALFVNTLLPLLALFVANQIEDIRWLKAINWSILTLGAFALVALGLHLPLAAAVSNGSRGLFPTWVGVLAYSQMLFNRDLARWKRVLLGLLFLGVVVQYFFVYLTWFSGWIPLAVACAAVTVMHSRRLTIIASVLILSYLALNLTFYFKDLYQTKVDTGDLQRLDIWSRNLSLVAKHPLLGMGPAGYAVYNVSYFPQDARSTHNNYFDVLAQTGVVGFAAFVWLLIAFIRTGLEGRRKLAGQAGFELAFASAALAGSFGVLVSMMLGDWVLPFAYNQTITGFDNACFTWVMLGAMVSLRHIGLVATHASAESGTSAEAV